MLNRTITIPIDPETARVYNLATPEEKRKMQALLSLWLRELTLADSPSLQEVLDDVGGRARERGLTPDILESILKGT